MASRNKSEEEHGQHHNHLYDPRVLLRTKLDDLEDLMEAETGRIMPLLSEAIEEMKELLARLKASTEKVDDLEKRKDAAKQPLPEPEDDSIPALIRAEKETLRRAKEAYALGAEYTIQLAELEAIMRKTAVYREAARVLDGHHQAVAKLRQDRRRIRLRGLLARASVFVLAFLAAIIADLGISQLLRSFLNLSIPKEYEQWSGLVLVVLMFLLARYLIEPWIGSRSRAAYWALIQRTDEAEAAFKENLQSLSDLPPTPPQEDEEAS